MADPYAAIADRGRRRRPVASGRLGETAAEMLKAEARGRVERGEFLGHIAYLSVIARLA